jgi:hypothetical protein
MKFRLTPKLPDYPGSAKTYPIFARVDNRPLSEYQKTRALLKLVSDEFDVVGSLAKTFGDQPVFRRLQIRHFASLLDTFFSTLNVTSLERESRKVIVVSDNDKQQMKGMDGVLAYYTSSIRIYAKAMGVANPNGDKLQLNGSALYWPSLRARITHPTSLEQYQFTVCDNAILVSIAGWFDKVRDWALDLQLKEIDAVKASLNSSLDKLRQEILGNK